MKDLQTLTNAVDAANKAGVYNLQEAGVILQAINNLGATLQSIQSRMESQLPPKGEETLKDSQEASKTPRAKKA